jgi:hypothetical protein
MKLTSILQLKENDKFWYRIWGYWRSPGTMKVLGLWSDRKDQQFRSFLMAQRGPGKSRPETMYEKLSKPKYSIKWVKKADSKNKST